MMPLSKYAKIKGTIKNSPEDFLVEEIGLNGDIFELGKTYSFDVHADGKDDEYKFSNFIMQKRDWNTAQALRGIAKKFRRGMKSVGFAGTKDRQSTSTQMCSIFGVEPERILGVHIKDISINGAWKSSVPVKLGDLLGNRFTVRIRYNSRHPHAEDIIKELGGTFPNYFGAQRFGSRGNNVGIGLSILKNDFKDAAMSFLTDTKSERNEIAIEARNRLRDEQDFKKALSYFPRYLKYELLVIEYLSRFPENYANAMRKLPRQTLLMFVHSVESEIFNDVVEYRIRNDMLKPVEGDILCGSNAYGFPDYGALSSFNGGDAKGMFIAGSIIGYNSDSVNDIEKEAMERLDISKELFKVKSMPEINCKGAYRAVFAPYGDMAYVEVDDGASMRFSLPSGSYATVLVNEFIDAK